MLLYGYISIFNLNCRSKNFRLPSLCGDSASFSHAAQGLVNVLIDPIWTSPNYWGYNLQQILKSDVHNHQKGTFTNPMHWLMLTIVGPFKTGDPHPDFFQLFFGSAATTFWWNWLPSKSVNSWCQVLALQLQLVAGGIETRWDAGNIWEVSTASRIFDQGSSKNVTISWGLFDHLLLIKPCLDTKKNIL